MKNSEMKDYTDPTIVTLGTVAELTAKTRLDKCSGSGDLLTHGPQENREAPPGKC